MNLVDSSGWLEYLADGPNAEFFAPAIEATEALVVPSLCILEVFQRTLAQRDERAALQALALMQQGEVVDLDCATAVAAASLGVRLKLALADGVVLATARAHGATLWTQDADFKGLEGVRYVAAGAAARSGRPRGARARPT